MIGIDTLIDYARLRWRTPISGVETPNEVSCMIYVNLPTANNPTILEGAEGSNIPPVNRPAARPSKEGVHCLKNNSNSSPQF